MTTENKPEEEYVCPHCGEKEHTVNEETAQTLRETDRGENLIKADSAEDMFKELDT